MLYKRLLKLKEDTQSITDLETTHQYLHSLKGTPTFHAQVLQRVFAKLYTLLNVYNIYEKLELVHGHYEANTMRLPSHSRPQLPPTTPTRSSHSSSRAKVVHLVTPILPSCNYCDNLAHKTSECNIPSKDLFCDYYGKEDIKMLFVLPSSQNESNSDYHGKICQHLLLPLNQKPRNFNLPLKLSPPRVILVRMLKKRNTMLIRRRCFKPMPLKFNLCKMNLNH
jgi:hypothetical protein